MAPRAFTLRGTGMGGLVDAGSGAFPKDQSRVVELTSSHAVEPRPHPRTRPVRRSTTHREPSPFVALAEPTRWSIVLIGSVVLGVALSQSSTLATAHLALTILVVAPTGNRMGPWFV